MKLISLLTLAILIAGCSTFGNPARDTDQYACGPNEPTNPNGKSLDLPSPSLVDIHLTSYGELVDRCQWDAAMLQLNNGGLDDQRSKIVLLHVHGWKQGAHPEDAERAAFAEILQGVAAGEQAKPNPSQVVGIFVAWPGARYAISALNNFTFLSRLTVADRISQSAIVAKLIGAVEGNLAHRAKAGKEDVFILMGYSLGARILFNATAQVLIYGAQLARPANGNDTYRRVDGPGDLVILMNPAISASNYSALDAIRRADEKFPVTQDPVVLTIASDNDQVIRYAFPLSQLVTFNWGREQRVAVGEYAPFATHRLTTRSGPQPDADPNTVWFDSFCVEKICLTREPPGADATRFASQRNPDLPSVRQPANPFIVAKASSEVVDGHSGVWDSETFSRWLSGFVGQILTRRAAIR